MQCKVFLYFKYLVNLACFNKFFFNMYPNKFPKNTGRFF